MRILHISSARAFGGGERHLTDLANALAKRGHDVYVAIRPASPLQGSLSELASENIITLPLRNALDLRSAIRLRHFVREKKIEIVHAHMARDYPLAALALWRSEKTRLIITRHVLFRLGRIHSLTLSRAACIIAVSEAVARALRTQKLFPPDKIRVIQNGIHLDQFALNKSKFNRVAYRAKLKTDAPLLIGTIGELSEVKGQEDFVRAASIVLQSWSGEVRFIIVGEDKSETKETRKRIEALIQELNLSRHVHLLGERNDVPAILSSLDLFISASRSEAFGLAIIEAMAAGLPVIATATEGASEIITDNITGKLVPIRDINALASAISNLLKDTHERRRLSDNARALVHEQYSIERMVEETEQVYFEVTSNS